MDSRQDSVSEQEWVIEFHRLHLILALLYAVCSVATDSLFIPCCTNRCSVKYVINVTTTDQMLTLEIENFDTSERWSGEFTSHCKCL